MENPRFYGVPPHDIAVIHGGPGAIGTMAPVARELGKRFGVIEPLQTEQTLEGQVQELREILLNNSTSPRILIGHSWGAWLSFIIAARFPGLVKKLILVGSGPFEKHYVPEIQKRRLERLTKEEGAELQSIIAQLSDPSAKKRDSLLSRLGDLASKSDSFDPLELETQIPSLSQGKTFQNVWTEASELRRTGKLLALGTEIRCPVVAIHGRNDPHPAEGVALPLSSVLSNFSFILLENCGHTPWMERQARAEFFAALEAACRS